MNPEPTTAPPASEAPGKPPIPAWVWIFVAACGLIPIITGFGAIPGALAGAGIFSCIAVARSADLPVLGRVGICAGITAICWVLLFIIAVAVVMIRG